MRHVTGVLRATIIKAGWQGMSAEQIEWFLNRGTQIHAATALLDRGALDWNSVDDRIAGFVAAWGRFRRDTGGTVEGIELPIRSERHEYCGTIDRLICGCAIWPIGRVVLDIKTNDFDQCVRLQTMGYRVALIEKHRKWRQPGRLRRAAVSLYANGTWKSELFTEDRVDEAAWLACLTLHRWMTEVKMIEPEERDN